MKVSIITPVHDMRNRDFFMKRIEKSLEEQTFRDFEWVVTENGKGMASNTNEAIKRAAGDVIKILFLDDYFAHKDALQVIVEGFRGGWLATACEHDDGETIGYTHYPAYSPDLALGVNTIGSPSVIAFENKEPLLFDENLSWTLDCDLYVRLYRRYGFPTVVDDVNVIIGVGDHQTTHILSDEVKLEESKYIQEKYAK